MKTEAEALYIARCEGRYGRDFSRSNEAWIIEYREIEETDHRVLDHPDDYIIELGGAIVIAIEDKTVAGTCALVEVTDGRFDYELANTVVDPAFRRRGAGQLLDKAFIGRARSFLAKTVFLESNTHMIFDLGKPTTREGKTI